MNLTKNAFHWGRWWMKWCQISSLDPRGPMAGPLSARSFSTLDWQVVRDSLPKSEDHERIEILDFGSPSAVRSRVMRSSLRTIERTASSDRRKASWLAAFSASAMAARRESINILELGTCLGAGALSLILGAQGRCNYIGLEGSPELAKMAECRIRRVAPRASFDIQVGPFCDTLPSVLASNARFDVVFLDGHHEGCVLLDQWNLIQCRLKEGAWVVVDDIRWSEDMYKAWSVLVERKGVAAYDLFRMGALKYFSCSNSTTQNLPRRVPLSMFA